MASCRADIISPPSQATLFCSTAYALAFFHSSACGVAALPAYLRQKSFGKRLAACVLKDLRTGTTAAPAGMAVTHSAANPCVGTWDMNGRDGFCVLGSTGWDARMAFAGSAL